MELLLTCGGSVVWLKSSSSRSFNVDKAVYIYLYLVDFPSPYGF